MKTREENDVSHSLHDYIGRHDLMVKVTFQYCKPVKLVEYIIMWT